MRATTEVSICSPNFLSLTWLRGAARLAVIAILAAPLAAQSTMPRIQVDVGTGLATTNGGVVRRSVPAALAFNGVVATPVRLWTKHAIGVGVSANLHLPMDTGTECTVDFGSNQCRPVYPTISSFAALVAWMNAHGRARLLVGPARFRLLYERSSLAPYRETRYGVQGRADVAFLPLPHAGLAFWAQMAATAPLNRDGFQMYALGVALRFQ